MRGIICGALMALTATPANAEADVTSANYMLPHCKLGVEGSPGEKAFTFGLCVGIVDATKDTFELLKAVGHKGWLCADIPANVTNAQAIKVILKYADQHPERTHYTLYQFSLEALRATWPCKN